MRKGTFSVQRAGANSSKHNSRETPPKYLIGLEDGTKNYYELIQSDNDFIFEVQNIYKEKIKQSMQKKQVENLIQETVLTLKKNQNENDVKELFKKLKSKYGGHEILEVSVHRDEGHFLKNGIAYYPTKNILQKENDWYICSDLSIDKPKGNDFDKKVDISTFSKVYNYHAHVKFSMFDKELGKSARMQKKDMSERIKFVSDELGLMFAPEKETSRIKKSVNQIKDEHLASSRAKEKIHQKANEYINTKTVPLAKVKDLNTQIDQLRNELIASKSATKEDYDRLKKEKEILKEEVKNKTLTIEQLQQQTSSLRTQLLNSEKEVNTLKTQINSLEAQKGSNPSIDTNLTIKSDSSPNMAYLIAHKTIEKDFERSFEKKEVINANTFQTESVQVLTPVPEEQSLYSRIKNNFKGMFEYMQKQYFELMQKFQELEKKNKELTNENAELKAKVKTLESEAPKQIKKETQDNPNVLDLLREMESKSISKEDTERFVKEVREQLSQLKNTGPDLIK